MKLKNKKIVFYSMIVFLIIIIISLVIIEYYPQTKNDFAYKSSNNIFIINDLFSTVFLVPCKSGYIAIDGGWHESVIMKGLEKLKIKPNEIKAVLLTHTDFDHIGALNLFSDANIYISKEEYEMVIGRIQRFKFLPFYANRIPTRQLKIISNNEEFMIADKHIKSVLLPGHTLGSTGFIIDSSCIFISDAMKIKKGKFVLPKLKYFVMNEQAMTESINKLLSIEKVKYIFSSNAPYPNDFETIKRNTLKSMK